MVIAHNNWLFNKLDKYRCPDKIYTCQNFYWVIWWYHRNYVQVACFILELELRSLCCVVSHYCEVVGIDTCDMWSSALFFEMKLTWVKIFLRNYNSNLPTKKTIIYIHIVVIVEKNPRRTAGQYYSFIYGLYDINLASIRLFSSSAR